ncbi:MAG TPA: serine/threonine-protein kinase [Tepidisphaeraceae bacterium]|nr:serine/threonine-protein kinase [Tepidisphaeraceae bacterium]
MFQAHGMPIPSSLFGYRVIGTLGEGAASVIYRVTDPTTKQSYALKHVIRKTEKDARFIDQLEAEFEVASKVRHPALRRCYDLKFNRTMLWKVTDAALIMELFEGEPLEFRLPDSVGGIVDVFITTAKALDSLHAMGYVHCDLKPNNILVSPRNEVKVIDLGQAVKVGTKKKRIQGTPDYIAPEQVKLAAVTVRTDVYNFGATMYWALTRRKLPTLFTAGKKDNSFVLTDSIPTPSDLNPMVPVGLSQLVMECVRTSPSKRPNDMGAIGKRLELIRHGLLALAERSASL